MVREDEALTEERRAGKLEKRRWREIARTGGTEGEVHREGEGKTAY